MEIINYAEFFVEYNARKISEIIGRERASLKLIDAMHRLKKVILYAFREC